MSGIRQFKTSALSGKSVLICVTGSIAAYKACEVIRNLRKENVQVQVAMTESALKFVGVATFSALTGNDVLTNMFPPTPKGGLEHIQLAIQMDAVVVLPATANILGKAARGIADDLVSTLLSVCEQPTLFVPAMNFRMWQNPATMEAVRLLRERGNVVMDPESGVLASLHEGEGRLPDVPGIMNHIRELFNVPLPLAGKRALITAGPTRESIDPVRFLSNRSSGKMGFALAESARDMGADVTLVTGPVTLPDPPEISIVRIESVRDLHHAMAELLESEKWDYLVMTAAPSDYMIESPARRKIKRSSENFKLELTPAPDILKSIRDKTQAIVVAFALETHDGEEEALRKMKEKGADFIVLNYANEPGAGFESSTNQVIVFSSGGGRQNIPKDRKDRVAKKILEFVLKES